MTPVEHAVAALFAPVGLAAFRRDVRGRQPMHREPSTGRLAAFHALASWSIDDLLAGHRGDATAWSERGNRTLNHALHLAAMCQLRQHHSDGRAYFDRRVAEGKTNKEGIRALKRQISNNVYRHLVADART
jgi:hypothetical protein